MFSERQLFGGAITCDIPSDWRDVSDIRQVPDHQECFQDFQKSQSVYVLEILERQSVSNEEAASFFFQDLAESNGSTENRFQKQGMAVPVANEFTISAGIGVQKVAVGKDHDFAGNRRQQEIHYVQVELCVFRLPNLSTDILLTISNPNPNPQDESFSFSAIFERAASTLKVRDWSLFG